MKSGVRESNAWLATLGTGIAAGKCREYQMKSPDQKGETARGGDHVLSASWRCNGPPRLRRVWGVRACPHSLGLRHCPDTYGWLQSRIFGNGRKPDRATPRAG